MKNPTYVSLFSSAGVGCHGLNISGYRCLATAEINERRLAIQKINRVCDSNDGYFQIDLSKVALQQLLIEHVENALLADKSELDFLLATPPCQGMSVANHKKNNETPRNSLVLASIEITMKLRPRVFVFENVRSFLDTYCVDGDGRSMKISQAIEQSMASAYTIYSFVDNLANFGSPSSRTRTLVIGVRNDQANFGPLDLVPEPENAKTLRALIGDMIPLSTMGEFDPKDALHHFRNYELRMLPWIRATTEGHSAFDNKKSALRPHRVVDGKIVQNVASNGDKYRRQYWDKIPPCVHTRNDILASQNTVHPMDDRVFSIRELMKMMGVPSTFKWFAEDLALVNALDHESKSKFLKRHDTNIRECLGEAVPTPVIQNIASKYLKIRAQNFYSDWALRISKFEDNNPKKKELAAYYTSQNVAQQLSISAFARLSKKKPLKVLEPSAGAGAFLVPLIVLLRGYKTATIRVCDIDKEAIEYLRENLSSIDLPENVQIEFVVGDTLEMQFDEPRYDLCIGNPPFGKPNPRSKNLFQQFIEMGLRCSKNLAFVVPKSLLNGEEFRILRGEMGKSSIRAIFDWGMDAFPKIKIETIGFLANTEKKQDGAEETQVNSRVQRSMFTNAQSYILDSRFPGWLLYRNKPFDKISQGMQLGFFRHYRDRSISKKHHNMFDGMPLVKGRDIKAQQIDVEIGSNFVDPTNVPRRLRDLAYQKNVFLAPNLTYYPRLARLPLGSVADGSAAYLIAETNLSNSEIKFYGSKLFFLYLRIAMNYSIRGLNIDGTSAYYWGRPNLEVLRIAKEIEDPGRDVSELFSLH